MLLRCRLTGCLLLLSALAGCMPSQATAPPPTVAARSTSATLPAPTATPPPPTVTPLPPTATATRVVLPTVSGTQAPIARLVSVGKYRLYLACTGSGSPTVVMDSGLGATGSAWALVAPKVAAVTRVCVYDRANTGRSDHAPTPRASQELVDDLHALLTNAGVAGPYVMVGHSLGGLNVRLYASEFPDSVVGMVLVDAAHEDLWDRLLSQMPAPTEGEPPEFKAYRNALNSAEGSERIDLQLSGAQVRGRRRPFGAMPLLVLSHGKPIAGIPALYSPLVERIWSDMQLDMLSLSTNSKQLIAQQSGHNIPSEQPQLVSDSIRQVVQALRNGSP
jgi:pimeloyl-ACP methyl ester carboxylesterase